ncbi:MAG: DUF502 domain-containing protein [Chitinophagales bacterium]|nr:DUF502 domain-containing protein [Chitinophagales bacterium]
MSKTKQSFKDLMNRIIRYFLQGLLLIAPIFVTLYSIFALFNMLDSSANDVFEAIFKFRFPGVGLLVMFVVVTFIGAVGSTIFIQPIMDGLESLLERTPLVKDIYSSIRDFVSAFLSNKKKFNKPVIVEMGKGLGIFKLGFITDADLEQFGITDKVAVYFPHSYNFSGNLFIVNASQVKELPTTNGSADVMKYIVSGGVMEMEDASKDAITEKQ